MTARAASGFTLLEVLVALVIVGLGMMAVFGQLNQSLAATIRLRDKTLAHWIAEDRITELRLGDQFPNIGQSSDQLEMGDVEWFYTVKVTQTPVANLRRLDVDVSFADRPDDILATLVGFIGPPVPSEARTNTTGWFLTDPDAALE